MFYPVVRQHATQLWDANLMTTLAASFVHAHLYICTHHHLQLNNKENVIVTSYILRVVSVCGPFLLLYYCIYGNNFQHLFLVWLDRVLLRTNPGLLIELSPTYTTGSQHKLCSS